MFYFQWQDRQCHPYKIHNCHELDYDPERHVPRPLIPVAPTHDIYISPWLVVGAPRLTTIKIKP